MARAPLPVKQADVTRAVRGALSAGVDITRVEVDPRKGHITLFTSVADDAPVSEYEKWKAGSSES